MLKPVNRDPKFPVGSRVRVARPDWPSKNKGRVGTVREVLEGEIGGNEKLNRPPEHVCVHVIVFDRPDVGPDGRNYGRVPVYHNGRCLDPV